MSALTITAVDFTTENITITAHGLATGAGPAAIYTAAGVLPSPLAAVTDYWVIRVDANTIRLASSSALAIAGTAINLTTNGSGTLLLLVGLPYRRPRTAAAATQVFSADANATWDSLVALWNVLTGQAQSIYSGVTLAGLTIPTGQSITLQGTADMKHGTRTMHVHGLSFVAGPVGSAVTYGSNGAAMVPLKVFAPVNLPEGSRVLAIRTFVQDSATGPTKVQVFFYSYVASTGTAATIGTSAQSAGTGARQTLPITALTATIATGTLYSVQIDTTLGSANGIVTGMEIDYDRP